MRVQTICDYVCGRLGDLSVEELREILHIAGVEQQDMDTNEDECYDDLLQAVCSDLDKSHQISLNAVAQLTNEAIGHKQWYLKMLHSNVMARGLEDLRLCTSAERTALADLLANAQCIIS